MNANKRILRFTAAALLGAALIFSSQAVTEKQAQNIRRVLKKAPAPERPAKAAELISKADKKDQADLTAFVVREVIALNPASAPIVVSVISKEVPDVAAVAAAEAVKVSKDQAAYIARAAALAAPGEAGLIAAEVIKVVPAQSQEITSITGTQSGAGSASAVAAVALDQTAAPAATSPSVSRNGNNFSTTVSSSGGNNATASAQNNSPATSQAQNSSPVSSGAIASSPALAATASPANSSGSAAQSSSGTGSASSAPFTFQVPPAADRTGTRSFTYDGPPTSGNITNSDQPINQTNRTGNGGNQFPSTNQPPQQSTNAAPLPANYSRTQ